MKKEDAELKLCSMSFNHQEGVDFCRVEKCMQWIPETTADEDYKFGHCAWNK